jgi:type II secretory pathway component PulK
VPRAQEENNETPVGTARFGADHRALGGAGIDLANSMSFELRAADNRVAAIEAEQAVTGAARYVSYILGNLEEPGVIPDPRNYLSEGIPIGDSRFWLLGRSTNGQVSLDVPFLGLVDETSKMNLNTATLEMLEALPRMTPELAAAIIDWRDENQDVTEGGAESETYAMRRPAYRAKDNRFETVEELRLVRGAQLDVLYGEDANLNGVLDPNENDGDSTPPADNRDGRLDPGILDCLTVYSREGNTRADGSSKINVGTQNVPQQLRTLLQTELGTARGNAVISALGQPPGRPAVRSLVEFYIRSRMTLEEFAKVEADLTIGTQPREGLININTAGERVLACIPGLTNYASALVSYRQSNPDKIQSVAWLTEVVEQQNALQAGPYVTTRSYQFTADVCAVGRYGRGFQRANIIFDTSSGAPQMRFRQDLTRLGWPLGQTTRTLLANQRETR